MEYMAELEMAIRSTVEVFAENMEISLQRHAVTFPEPRAPAHGVRSHASQSRAARFLGLGRQLTGAAASSPEHHHRGTPLAEEGSDGEDGHADDAEVKSLALSEDGPVIRRSVSEPYYNFFPRQTGESSNRNVLAPDPLAMLSDGERTVGGERAIGGRGEPVLAFRKHLPLPLLAGLRDERDLADDVDEHVERERGLGEFGDTLDGEPLGSDRSAPNESDHSADHSGLSGATTHVAHARLGLSSLDPDQQILINNLDSDLLPILEKVACSGGMPPGVRSGRRAPNPRTTALAQRGDETDGYKRVPAKHGATVADLSQISRLPIPPGSVERFGRPHSSRSDNASQLSFGSANSAFSPPSSLLSPSSSSSALASPRPPTGLKASQSTPTIHVSTHKSAHQGR